MDDISKLNLPVGVKEKIDEVLSEIELNPLSRPQNTRYINWLSSLPWTSSSKEILDLNYAKEKLNEYHYGLEPIKERILEYISIIALFKERNSNTPVRAPIFLFYGLAGTGKTTMAESIASALNREYIRIPLGGLGDPFYLRGRSRLNPDSEPGAIIKSLSMCKTNNPVILLDEIDRIAPEANNTIMGVLLELLDPEQNQHFLDHYLDYPFDLSQVIFCATCNNTSHIATAVLDRLDPIQMPSYTDEEKTVIGRDYIFPKAIKSAGLTAKEISIKDSVWPLLIRPLGFDAGVRTLKRNIETVCRKVALIIFSRKATSVSIDENNYKQFIFQ
jgi:ATP-dependent Lon protease